MKGVTVLLLAGLVLLSAAAAACGPPPPVQLDFAEGSSILGADALSSMNPALSRLRSHGPNCASFAVYVYGNSESESSRRLAEARADRIKKTLINFGAKPALIKTFVRSATDRRGAELYDYGAAGRLHCDPRSKNAAYLDGANCQPQYARCYVQLEDGTICNYDAVPDPNPVRYSVTP